MTLFIIILFLSAVIIWIFKWKSKFTIFLPLCFISYLLYSRLRSYSSIEFTPELIKSLIEIGFLGLLACLLFCFLFLWFLMLTYLSLNWKWFFEEVQAINNFLSFIIFRWLHNALCHFSWYNIFIEFLRTSYPYKSKFYRSFLYLIFFFFPYFLLNIGFIVDLWAFGFLYWTLSFYPILLLPLVGKTYLGILRAIWERRYFLLEPVSSALQSRAIKGSTLFDVFFINKKETILPVLKEELLTLPLKGTIFEGNEEEINDIYDIMYDTCFSLSMIAYAQKEFSRIQTKLLYLSLSNLLINIIFFYFFI